MSTATTAESGPSYVNAEMAKAYDEAIRSVERERSQPTHIREARTRALLRWLDKNN